MPLSYAGVVEEHLATRSAVGLFDVSHLGKAVVRGDGAVVFMTASCSTTSTGSVPATRNTRCAATRRPAA